MHQSPHEKNDIQKKYKSAAPNTKPDKSGKWKDNQRLYQNKLLVNDF